MTAVGITGHQTLSTPTRRSVTDVVSERLRRLGAVVGISSLASGADQLFAECVVRSGGRIVVVVPSAGYETTFEDADTLEVYRKYLSLAVEVVELPFETPTEEAFFAAGKEVVDRSDLLLAIWDGEPPKGLGGTADVVSYARARGTPVEIIWPFGSSR